MEEPTPLRVQKRVPIATWSELEDRVPTSAKVAGVELVVLRYDDRVSVLYGRCLHRGALLADGHVEGENLICGLHGWDYRIDSGVSAYANDERLERFRAWIDSSQDAVLVDESEIAAWVERHPQPHRDDAYLGRYADPHVSREEPTRLRIEELARDGLSKVGHHGPTSAMGVPLVDLPRWDDLQLLTAQLARRPLLDDEPVATAVTLGRRARRPLELALPIFVSDMSFGALSEEAKVALARGAERAGTAICSGEGGMLPEERAECSRYVYELASGRFGWDLAKVEGVRAFHFKAGQGAKTGTGGHLPGHKVTEKIAAVRGLRAGEAAISPATFRDLRTAADYRRAADEVRERSGGIPIGVKMSAQHIEDDLDFALEIGVDYVILDGRGGATGAAPELFKDHISVPTIPALARARAHLDRRGADDVSLVITGGLRTAPDFVKALALGADAIAIANSALQALGCLAMRACHTNNCPVGIATQKPHLRARLDVDAGAERVARFLHASAELMTVLARACGHASLDGFRREDLTTWNRDMAYLSGVRFSGASPLASSLDS